MFTFYPEDKLTLTGMVNEAVNCRESKNKDKKGKIHWRNKDQG